MYRLVVILLALFGAASSPVMAAPEVHVVGIYEGFSRTDGRIHGPKARVVLDRPEAEVVLVLSSYSAVLWEVALAPGTHVPRIVLSQLVNEGRRSEVQLNGEALRDPERMDLPIAFHTEGNRFRTLVAKVPELFDGAPLAGFAGDYTAPQAGFMIAGVSDDPRLGPDPLKAALSAQAVPESLRALIGPAPPAREPTVRLTGAGFETRLNGSRRLIALPLEMPQINWPVAAVRDDETGTLYGVTLGGEGLIYAFDEATEAWRIVASMENEDATALFLDAPGRRLIMPLARGGSVRVAIVELKGGASAPVRILGFQQAFAGLNDLFEPGNGPMPPLFPVGVDGEQLLLVGNGNAFLAGRRPGPGDASPVWRAWLVDLSTGTVTLVGYAG